jgi:hypothetical protein
MNDTERARNMCQALGFHKIEAACMCRILAAAFREVRAGAFGEGQKYFESRRNSVHVPSGYYGVEGALAGQSAYEQAASWCDDAARASQAKE